MSEKLLPTEIWDIIISQLGLQDRLIFVFTVIGQEKSIKMGTSAAYFLDHNQEYQHRSIPEIRKIIIGRLEVAFGQTGPVYMHNFYSGCCDIERLDITITYGNEHTFTLYPDQLKSGWSSDLDLHRLIDQALLDETGTSYANATRVESEGGITLRGKCTDCDKKLLRIESKPPECSVCKAAFYPCLQCNCYRWYCNKHLHLKDSLFGWCQCGTLVCSGCGFLCHEGHCLRPVCSMCSRPVDCCIADDARKCYQCKLQHPRCGATVDLDDY